MKISWLGQACFHIESGNVSLVIDPYSSRIGIELPTGLRADIVTESHQHLDHNDTSMISGSPKILNTPGMFDLGEIKINGIPAFHDSSNGAERGPNIVFAYEIEGIKLCHLGDLGHLLSQDQLDDLGHIDVLMVPVGGRVTLDPDEVQSTIKSMDPKVILPMHYQTPERQGRFQLRGVEEFLEDTKIKNELMDELILTKEVLRKMMPTVVVLRSKGRPVQAP